MHWGKQCPLSTLAPALKTPLLFVFLLEETWSGGAPPGINTAKSGRMILLRATQLSSRVSLGKAAFHVTLATSSTALNELLAEDNTFGGERVRRYAVSREDGWIELPLSPTARFSAESIRRCPFAGACRGLALTARGLDLLTEFIAALGRSTEPTATIHLPLHDTLAQVRAAAARLQSNLEHPPSIAELASAVGLSESTLKRGFHQLYQTTPFGYLRARRMEHARELLATGKATVLEAAAFVGYSNPSNFAATFKKQFGINPKTFQMSARR